MRVRAGSRAMPSLMIGLTGRRWSGLVKATGSANGKVALGDMTGMTGGDISRLPDCGTIQSPDFAGSRNRPEAIKKGPRISARAFRLRGHTVQAAARLIPPDVASAVIRRSPS